MTPDDRPGGPDPRYLFDVVPVALPQYRTRATVPCEVDAAAVCRRLTTVGGRTVPWTLPSEDRTVGAIVTRLSEWAKPATSRSSVLFWAGHGFSNGQTAHLVAPGESPGGMDHTVSPEMLAGYIRDECKRRSAPHWAIVVIQACGAGHVARRVWEYLEREMATAGVVLVAAGPEQGDGYAGNFLAALDPVLARPTSNDKVFSLDDFTHELKKRMEAAGGRVRSGLLHGRLGNFLPVRTIGPITAPVDVYRELRAALDGLPAGSDLRFVNPGLGVAVGEFGWYFSGRHADRTAILDWLTNRDHGLFVLTGDSGCGKSAILGNVLLQAHPDVRALLGRLGRAGADWPEATRLPPVDGILPLTGATLTDVIRRLAGAAGVPTPSGGGTPEDLITGLTDALRGRPPEPPLTVFGDGLDEAAEPGLIATALRRATTGAGIRVVMGTRPGRAGPALGDGRNLLDQLGRGQPHVAVVEVDRSGDAAAIEEYVVRRLTAADGPRHALEAMGYDAPSFDAEVSAVARRIAGRRGSAQRPRPFLYARLVVREILSDPELLTPDGRDRLQALLELDHGGLFHAALTRMSSATSPAAHLVEPFLRALAYGRGLGLPRDEPLWTAAARALAGTGDALLTDEDLDDVLAIAGPYVLLDSADGRSVYRLAHHTFRSYFLDRTDRYAATGQLKITRALLRAARTPLHPYLRHHLSGHAAAACADGWAALATRPDVLDQLDVGAVTADVMADPDLFGALPPAVLGTVVTGHLALAGTPADRTGLRRIGTARITGGWSVPQTTAEVGAVTAAGAGVIGTAWELRWARIRRDPAHVTLAGHDRPVRALAVLPMSDGRSLLASGGDDGTVRLWDLRTGDATGTIGPSADGRIFDLAALDRPPAGTGLVVAREDEPVLVWTVTDRTSEAILAGQTPGTVRTVLTLTTPGLGPVVVTGDVNGVLRLCRPGATAAAGTPMTGHSGPIHAAVPVPADAGNLLATAGHDRAVRLWDPGTQRLVRRFPDGHARPIRAMAMLSVGGGPGILVTGDDDGAVLRWDVGTGLPVGEPLAHGRRVSALGTCTVPGAGVLVVSGDEHGMLRFWEPVSGTVWGGPVVAHDGPVRRILAIAPGGGREVRTRLVTAGHDGAVRIWDGAELLAAAQRSAGRAAAPHDAYRADRLWTTADGERTLLAGCGPDDAVRYWDWFRGEPVDCGTGSAGVDRSDGWALRVPDGRELRVITEPGRTCITSRAADSAKPVAVPGRAYAAALTPGPASEILVVLAGHDATLSIVRETATEWAVQRRLVGHTDRVAALAVAICDTGQQFLLSGGDDRTVRVWSPDDDEPRHVIPLGARVRAMATSGADVAVAIDDGIVVLRLVPEGFAAGGKGYTGS
jgi:WD40 repeat protein